MAKRTRKTATSPVALFPPAAAAAPKPAAVQLPSELAATIAALISDVAVLKQQMALQGQVNAARAALDQHVVALIRAHLELAERVAAIENSVTASTGPT